MKRCLEARIDIELPSKCPADTQEVLEVMSAEIKDLASRGVHHINLMPFFDRALLWYKLYSKPIKRNESQEKCDLPEKSE